MKTEMFIPSKIRVGFRERSDTFTGKLAYVIYYDEKGKIRKQTSWEGWRDSKIEPFDFDNTPRAGYTLNKGVKRDNYWRNSGRSMIRVWDPRDFEFEISVDNLIDVLMHADVSKRDITEPCVFAWYGTELVLLPTNSEAYQQSVAYTNKQSNKVTSKSMIEGATYALKKDPAPHVYLGRFQTYRSEEVYVETKATEPNAYPGYFYSRGHTTRSYGCGYRAIPRKGLSYCFWDLTRNAYVGMDSVARLSHIVDADLHSGFADFVDKMLSHHELHPTSVPILTTPGDWAHMRDDDVCVGVEVNGTLYEATLTTSWGRWDLRYGRIPRDCDKAKSVVERIASYTTNGLSFTTRVSDGNPDQCVVGYDATSQRLNITSDDIAAVTAALQPLVDRFTTNMQQQVAELNVLCPPSDDPKQSLYYRNYSVSSEDGDRIYNDGRERAIAALKEFNAQRLVYQLPDGRIDTQKRRDY